jgi:lipopolysaccharide transport system ATP-binding protein
MKPIIKAENLGKQYKIGARQERYLTFRDALSKIALAPIQRFRRNMPTDENSFWALRNLSFEIMPGEVIGIVGRNGAGKSTLLKVLSRITEPTTGQVDLYGRVGSLLEVGTGFHPELTGRENIYLNGAVLGMNRREIERHFDEIVAFAEVEKFIDTAVKHYSSGMYLRLAFAVAAHLEPEILVVDEVLAVGDASFQKKCLGKMKSVANAGRTVLFVSHNLTALQSLCNRALWLDKGQLKEEGASSKVISTYLQTTANVVLEQVWHDPETAPGNEHIKLHSARITGGHDGEFDVFTIKTPLRIEFEFWNTVPDARLNLSLNIFNLEGIHIFNTASATATHGSGLVRYRCYIPADLLNDDTYRLMIIVVKDESTPVFIQEDILVFDVSDVSRDDAWYGKVGGAVRPKLVWETDQQEVSVP